MACLSVIPLHMRVWLSFDLTLFLLAFANALLGVLIITAVHS
ncbi:hypothetical protein HNQ07_004167 [Deinococcus metalli]|uniref:Uncharacterized protein n=1 Tax=Deinococcus metalli TaxID=1141878 RepID=A0A7W8KIR8_9DEIO|nr:hypothetical protein [Deinococcus metalli]